MKYLTSIQVLYIHDQIIKRFGGSSGLRDISLLESAVGRPQVTFDGVDLYPDIFTKAAALIHSLLKNHQFVDGNKRTSYVSVGLFLEMNGCVLSNQHEDAVTFTMNIENGNLSLEEIVKWIKKHTKKVK